MLLRAVGADKTSTKHLNGCSIVFMVPPRRVELRTNGL